MRKISSEFAITVIVILGVVLGGLIWLEGAGSWKEQEVGFSSSPMVKKSERLNQKENSGTVSEKVDTVSEEPTHSADWKTYEDYKLGIRIGCSSEYRPQVDKDTKSGYVFSIRKVGKETSSESCEAGTCVLSVKVSNAEALGKKAKSPEEFTQALVEQGKEFSEMMINGRMAYRYDEGNSIVSFFETEEGYIRYDFLVKDLTEGDAILALFKFPASSSQEVTLQ